MRYRIKQLLAVPIVAVLIFFPVLRVSMASADPSITEFPFTLPNESIVQPYSIGTGSDGNLWITLNGIHDNYIGRMTTNGTLTTYNLGPSAAADSIVTGSDGSLWYTLNAGYNSYIGRITTSGSMSQYAVPTPNSPATVRITPGPDGALWFTDNGGNYIGRITTSGEITTYTLPTDHANPVGITSGPDGALWFTEASANKIGRITTSGVITEYPLPTPNAWPNHITSGPDGALWFTEQYTNQIGRITTSGAITEYPLTSLSLSGCPVDITSGPDNALWYTDGCNDAVGRISTTGDSTEFALPTPNYEPIGVTTGPDGALWFTAWNTVTEQPEVGRIAVASAAPSVPANLTASTPISTTPSLSWTAVTGATYYNIYRNGNLIDTISSNNTSYTDNSAPEGNNSYYVTALNDSGESGPSNNVSIYHAVLIQAINAGGGASGSFTADTDNTGGQTYSTSASVDTSEVTVMQAPQSVYQSVRYGSSFAYTLPGLTPNANYTVRLHFSEPYWGTTQSSGAGGIGSRLFNVAVNGQAALTNFDVYKTAGGANRAIVEDVPATADSNGNVVVQFTSDTDNAMVSGIELYDGTLPTEPAYQVQNPITSEAINAGGNSDGSYVADTNFSAGQTYSTTASIDTSGVANPAPASIYQSVRYGNFSYELHNLAPNSSYTVQLQFSEPYYGAGSNGGGVGSRVFNVAINGTQVLSNFDVYQTAGGANKAIEQDFTAQTDANGNLIIQFTGVTNGAIVNGINVAEQ